jgi:hypothetical protein
MGTRRNQGLRQLNGLTLICCIRVKVQSWSANRSFNLLGMLAFLGLSICVFAWGLQYKLSLYDPAQATSHQNPQAKLLSRNEQTATTAGPRVIRTKTSTRVSYTAPTTVFFALLVVFCVLSPQLSGQREERASDSWHLRRGQLDFFFVRPPPYLV